MSCSEAPVHVCEKIDIGGTILWLLVPSFIALDSEEWPLISAVNFLYALNCGQIFKIDIPRMFKDTWVLHWCKAKLSLYPLPLTFYLMFILYFKIIHFSCCNF